MEKITGEILIFQPVPICFGLPASFAMAPEPFTTALTAQNRVLDMDPVEIFVVSKDDAWRVRAGDTFSRPFASETEAIQVAMKQAGKLAKAGYESRVVMRVMTCPFGPGGMGRAFPTGVPRTVDNVAQT